MMPNRRSTRQTIFSTYNITLWRIRRITVANETQQYILCVLFSYMSLQTIPYRVLNKNKYKANEVAGNNEMYLGLHVNCLIFLSDFNHILSVSAGFHHSPPYHNSRKSIQYGSRADTCEHGQTDGQIHMTKLIGAFCDYANVPKMHQLNTRRLQHSHLIHIQKRKTGHVQTLKTNFLVTYESKYKALYFHNGVQTLSDHILL
jgi:hypothetical protein